MAVKNGGIIGPANTHTGGRFGVAKGVWRLADAINFTKNGTWPTVPTPVTNTCRFDDGSSDYLKRTPAGAGDSNRIFTLSFWFKRSNLTGAEQYFFEVNETADNNDNFRVIIGSGENLIIQDTEANVSNLDLRTNRLFRDISAWYHLVLKVDTTQVTSSDRAKLYINGVQETSFSTSTYPSQNYDTNVSQSGEPFIIGRRESTVSPTSYFDGYLAEYCFIDGQALDPSYFGETNAATGIWVAKTIGNEVGSFGTNGFFLDFSDSSNLGKDLSPNGNDFTVNNLTSIDQTTDTPANNYCTLNPLDVTGYIAPGEATFSEGNTVATTAANDDAVGTFGVDQGKWYFEIEHTNGGNLTDGVGFVNINTEQEAIYRDNGNFRFDGSDSAYAATWQTAGDIIGVALDLDNTTISFYKNGVSQGNAKTDLPSGTYIPIVYLRSNAGTSIFKTNFGNPAFTISSGNSDANGYGNFEYAVPSGYYALNSANLNTYG